MFEADKTLTPHMLKDRRQAEKDLAGKFVVKPAGQMPADPKQRPPNMVTPEQYKEIVARYSDVRLGTSNLQLAQLDGLPKEVAEARRAKIMEDLGRIMQTENGRKLVSDLAQGGPRGTKVTTIGDSNDPHVAKALPPGVAGDEVPSGHPAIGTPAAPSVGASSNVSYPAGQSYKGPRDCVRPQDAGLPMRSDVTLFHELVHGRQQMQGRLNGTAITSGPTFDHKHGIGEHEQEARQRQNAYTRERHAIARLSPAQAVKSDPVAKIDSDKDLKLRWIYACH